MIKKLKNGKMQSLVASMTLLIVILAGSWPVNAQIRESGIEPKQATSLDIVAYSSITADLAQNIIGDAGEIDVIIEGSTDIHSYEPTASDIALVDDADIFLLMANKTATGIGLEGNYDQILSAVESSNPGLQVVFAVNDSTVASFGITIEHDDLIDKDNPHVWMSPLSAINMTNRIFTPIFNAESNASLHGPYVNNRNAYLTDLIEIATWLQNTTLLYSKLEDYNVTVHHPAFKYFLDILGVQRIASIEEGGAHGEPDPEHLAEVIAAMKSNNTKVIINQPQLDDADVKEIAKETGAHVADLTPLLGVKGVHTYIDMIVFDLIQLLNPVDPFTGGGKSVPGYSVFVMAGCLFLTAIVMWFTRFRKREKAVKAA